MFDVTVKNKRKLQPPKGRKADYQNDREKKIKRNPKDKPEHARGIIPEGWPKKQPAWILQEEGE
jgi:hypothetical protein